MTVFRAVSCSLVLLLPLQALAGQGQAGSPPKMTPEQRVAAQAKLDSQVNQLNRKALDVPRTQLRNAAFVMRDSISAMLATSALIVRARATNSIGVERSQARLLHGQCAAAQRTSVATLAAIAELHTPDPKGNELLLDYRAALGEVGRKMVECDKALAVASSSPSPSSVRISAAMSEVSAAATRHDRAFEALMHAMEIPVPRVR
jgi:hypothetical protein